MAEPERGGERFLVVGLGGLAFRLPPGSVGMHDTRQVGAGRK